jgi:hypothetical protein
VAFRLFGTGVLVSAGGTDVSVGVAGAEVTVEVTGIGLGLGKAGEADGSGLRAVSEDVTTGVGAVWQETMDNNTGSSKNRMAIFRMVNPSVFKAFMISYSDVYRAAA